MEDTEFIVKLSRTISIKTRLYRRNNEKKRCRSNKKLLIQMWLNDEWITTSPRIDFQLKEVFRLIMATTPPREDFSEEKYK